MDIKKINKLKQAGEGRRMKAGGVNQHTVGADRRTGARGSGRTTCTKQTGKEFCASLGPLHSL